VLHRFSLRGMTEKRLGFSLKTDVDLPDQVIGEPMRLIGILNNFPSKPVLVPGPKTCPVTLAQRAMPGS
jgi:hypothetical protein